MTKTTVEIAQHEEPVLVGLSGFRLLKLLATPIAVAAILLVLLNVLVIRVFDYYYWVEPESVMGTMVHTAGLVEHQIVPGKKNIIVIGDSRVGEGFSALVANAASQRSDLNFIQAGMPGTEPRVWYYFLRKVDPEQKKFAGIVLMASHFDDYHQYFDSAARTDDLTFLQPLTSFRDALDIARSYDGVEAQASAFLAMALPFAAAQADIQDGAVHLRKRAKKAKFWHEHYFEWSLSYPGRSGSVPTLARDDLTTFDFASIGWPRPKVDEMNLYVKSVLGHESYVPAGRFRAYRKKWYGAIADEYRNAGVRVLVFQIPRGPYEAYDAPSDEDRGTGALRELAKERRLTLLDFEPLAQLEKPQYFFDAPHLNDLGRKAMSVALARLLSQQFEAAR